MADPAPAGSDVSAGTYKCTYCGNELKVGSTSTCRRVRTAATATTRRSAAGTRPTTRIPTRREGRVLPLVRGVRAARAGRPGATRRAGRLPRPVDLGSLPPVERRAGPQPVRVVGHRRARRGDEPARDHGGSRARPSASIRRSSPRPRPPAASSTRGASSSALAAARRSTSTSSATAGRKPRCGWRCWKRPWK